jgi:hypothetical protein
MILNVHETRTLQLLVRIAQLNDEGVQPNKQRAVGSVPSRTRAYQYKRIDNLISRGLVKNVSDNPNSFALVVTELGRGELLGWGY